MALVLAFPGMKLFLGSLVVSTGSRVWNYFNGTYEIAVHIRNANPVNPDLDHGVGLMYARGFSRRYVMARLGVQFASDIMWVVIVTDRVGCVIRGLWDFLSCVFRRLYHCLFVSQHGLLDIITSIETWITSCLDQIGQYVEAAQRMGQACVDAWNNMMEQIQQIKDMFNLDPETNNNYGIGFVWVCHLVVGLLVICSCPLL